MRHVAVAVALMVSLAACGSDSTDDPTSAATSATSAAPESATSTPDDSTPDDSTPDDSTPDDSTADDSTAEELFPDVLEATARQDGDGTWTFAATLSSPYDSPERYADAWRVVGPDGTVYGIRELAHDHAGEQPFTRDHSGIEIPDDVEVVTVEGRDQISGWGGATVDVPLE